MTIQYTFYPVEKRKYNNT